MKSQLITTILAANAGNLFADFTIKSQVAGFLFQQNESFLRGIAQRCSALRPSPYLSPMTDTARARRPKAAE